MCDQTFPLFILNLYWSFSSPRPKRSAFCAAGGSFWNGVSIEIFMRLAKAWMIPLIQVPSASPQVTTAPSRSDLDRSGTTRSGSTSKEVPSPSQVLHAPYGLLKLKYRGSGGS